MSDFNTLSILRMQYPDDPADMTRLEWFTLKNHLTIAAARILSENLIADELESISRDLWKHAHTAITQGEQPPLTQLSVVTETTVVSNPEILSAIKRLQSLSEKLKQ